MSVQKRCLDVVLALLLGVLCAPLLCVLLIWLWIKEGRPLFYVSERMKRPDQPFQLWKLRTMTLRAEDGRASGGHKGAQITKSGRWLRDTRLDELPQLWNILRGDMSFVGPRPPLRTYVERFPQIYAQVLISRPGVTGLATLHYHRHEALLLQDCRAAEQAEAIYIRRCVPQKARIDLIYQRHQSIGFDLALMLKTLALLLQKVSKP